jgi:transposase-like protein
MRQTCHVTLYLPAAACQASRHHKHHCFPVEVIGRGVWLYFHLCLSYRAVEVLLFARGIIVTYKTIRIVVEPPPSRLRP